MPDRLPPGVRFRRALYRPAVRRTSVALVALGTAFAVTTFLQAEEEARGRWGKTRPVVVAQRDLQPGDRVDSSAVAVRRLPDAVVTDAALSAPPVGSVVRYPVVAGEPLVGERLAPEGVTGAAALVPRGHRAIGLPRGQLGTPPLQVGDVVDVLVVLPPDGHAAGYGYDHGGDGGESGETSSESGHRGGQEVAELAAPLVVGARVVDVAEDVVTVAVPRDDAASLAYAATSGVVMLTLAGA